MTTGRRSYTSGNFQLTLDGLQSSAYLKSVEGGDVKANLIEEPIGIENQRIKHTSTVEIEPFSFEIGMSGADDVLKWIEASWEKKWNRRDGQVTHADFDFKTTYIHEFYEALVTETTFPTLDGSSKDAAYLKFKILPQRVETKKESGPVLRDRMGAKQKLWLASSFRMNIDGMNSLQYVNKIESFTIKQGVKKLYFGKDRYPQIEPTKLDFPNIVCNISLEYADEILAWYNKYVVHGQSDLDAQKTGSIEFLSPDRRSTIFTIKLSQMGILSATLLPSTANAEQIKRMKFELYVGQMELVAGSGFD